MTVSELIEHLKELPQNASVLIKDEDRDIFFERIDCEDVFCYENTYLEPTVVISAYR